MYVEGPFDRGLIRRALSAMSEMALDEVTDAKIDEMFSENVAFILAALRGLTSEHHRGLPIVTENFGENEILRLDRLRDSIAAASVKQFEPFENVMLTEAEVAQVLAESDELAQKLNAITKRLSYLQRALYVSGETKLREMRHIRTWYYDDENTHGIKGLACVSDERTTNLVGVGPDHEFTGTAEELVASLRGLGFTELETDIEILSIAWRTAPDS